MLACQGLRGQGFESSRTVGRFVSKMSRGWLTFSRIFNDARYDLSELDLRRLAVTFRSGVQFVVSTEPDYPKGGGVELIEVRKADGKLDVQTFKELKVGLRPQFFAFTLLNQFLPLGSDGK